MADVEALNRSAFDGEAAVTKLSYHAYAYCTGSYVLLDAGSALGRNCGPLLIARRAISKAEVAAGDVTIAIPGRYTTANFLLGLAFPEARKKTALLFSGIERALLDGEYDAGVIIHENRFTYEARGLKKIVDLGEFWEAETGTPIPLGGIVVNRSLPDEVKQKVKVSDGWGDTKSCPLAEIWQTNRTTWSGRFRIAATWLTIGLGLGTALGATRVRLLP